MAAVLDINFYQTVYYLVGAAIVSLSVPKRGQKPGRIMSCFYWVGVSFTLNWEQHPVVQTA